MSKDVNSFTHYLVVDERILGEARVVEKVSDFVSLALICFLLVRATPIWPVNAVLCSVSSLVVPSSPVSNLNQGETRS